jgi:hypothetical protein
MREYKGTMITEVRPLPGGTMVTEVGPQRKFITEHAKCAHDYDSSGRCMHCHTHRDPPRCG